jgi:NifU-like protein involved in Fe-S cluster formation
MTYSPLVESHFTIPRNVGRFDPALDVIVANSGSKDQGVEIVLSARIENERIVALNHLVYGCPHTIAAASWLTERLCGATQDDLARWRWREVATALEVPPEKWGRLLVLEDAVRALQKGWRNRRSTHAQTA